MGSNGKTMANNNVVVVEYFNVLQRSWTCNFYLILPKEEFPEYESSKTLEYNT